MNKPKTTQLSVTKSVRITPNMQRITLQGHGLNNFPSDCEGSYIKLLFDQRGTTDLTTLQPDERPVMRTYTISRFFPSSQTIDVDFVRHETCDLNCGFAGRWAMNVNIGDTINIAGPGNSSLLNTTADWYFMVGDMTSLPALSAKLRTISARAKGYVVIKIIEQSDIQHIAIPSNMQVIWTTDNDSMLSHVTSLPWLDGDVSVWVACEFDMMRAMRNFFRNEKEVAKDNIYISSYWKKGVSEDGHKIIKRQDAASS